MTREEAIEILKQFKKCLADVVFDEKGSEAWQMAIQALSQEPTVTSTDEPMTMVYPTIFSDDAISRQAVINAIENDCMRGGLGSCFACYNDAQAFRGEIEKLPSVTLSRQIDIEIRDLKWQIASKDQIIEDIKNDIRHIVDEESEIDERWARGLHYALCIIEKHWNDVEPQESEEQTE